MTSANAHSLTIVIPALNEEDAIGDIITRCLAASEEICRSAGLQSVEVIVVNDGSTDRTSQIARSFDGVSVIDFAKNRGYGAAIAEGFARGRGTLLGFLDADGTCDPLCFGPMCRAAVKDGAEIVLGSRLGPGSQMPKVRRLGNRLYALMLGLLTGRSVTDTASGMRVLRREAFEELAPLPVGLHFTPAMSARALVNNMRVVEIPMPYAERVGESKLHVLRDGVRFLRAIFAGILCFRPDRLFLLGSIFCLLGVIFMGLYPTEYYLHHGAVQEWFIYRFMACFVLSSSGFTLLCAMALSHKMASLGPRGRQTDSFWSAVVAGMFQGKGLAVLLLSALVTAVAILWPGIIEYLTTTRCTLHWSRLVVGAFLALTAFQTATTWVLIQLVALWAYQNSARQALFSKPREASKELPS